ncbi:MAG TPA: hypothetical protein VLF71_04685 [Candidatus Saccharimonadales bacterium]|nr:hypothetical protein [Candidatus Saccharimonadales bacterium]
MKKVRSFLLALVLSLSSLGVFIAPHAFAATKTWTGTAGDHKFSTAGNWSPSGAPGNGDSLVFDNTSVTDFAPNDDQSSASYALITFQGTGSSSFTLAGNAFTLTGGVANTGTVGYTINNNVTISGNQTFATVAGGFESFGGVVSGSGNISKTGAGPIAFSGANSGYTGTLTMAAGTLYAEAATAVPSAVLNDGSDIAITGCTTFDYSGNLTLNGASSLTTGDNPTAKVTTSMGACSGGASDEQYGNAASSGNMNMSGNIVLGADTTFATSLATMTLTGALSGAHSMSVLPGYAGKLVVNGSSNSTSTPNGTVASTTFTKTLSDSAPTHTVALFGNTTITLDGARSDVNVGSGATLKGSGTTGVLSVQSGGTVAPGHSPGCLTSTGLVLNGTYQAEIGGTTPCTGYDQLKVNGTVDVTNGTLAISLYNGFKPATGQTYTIIDNDASDPVTGTFSGLAEGATVTVNGYVFKISYKGGTGNDVVLTVQNVPGTPNTGFTLVKDNPLASVGVILAAAAGMVLLARRSRSLAHRR